MKHIKCNFDNIIENGLSSIYVERFRIGSGGGFVYTSGGLRNNDEMTEDDWKILEQLGK